MVEAGPGGGGDASSHEANVAELGSSLRRWPVPFASREAAVEFFVGPSLNAEAWAGGLERRDGGWWPRFEVEGATRSSSSWRTPSATCTWTSRASGARC